MKKYSDFKKAKRIKININEIWGEFSFNFFKSTRYQEKSVKENHIFYKYKEEILISLSKIIDTIISYSKNKEKANTMKNELLLYILLKSCVFNMYENMNKKDNKKIFLINELISILKSTDLFKKNNDYIIDNYCNIFYFNGININHQIKEFIEKHIYSDFDFFESNIDEKILFYYLYSSNKDLPIINISELNVVNIERLECKEWSIMNTLFYMVNLIFETKSDDNKDLQEIKIIENIYKGSLK